MNEIDGYNEELDEQQETYSFDQAYQAMLHGMTVKEVSAGTYFRFDKSMNAIVARGDDGIEIVPPMTCEILDARYVAV